MGNSQSSVEDVEKDAFDVVHLSGNVLQRFRGTKGDYFTIFPLESRSNAKPSPSSLHVDKTIENPPNVDKSIENFPVTSIIDKMAEISPRDVVVDETLQSALLEQEALANRLRRDLQKSSDEANEMRKELKRLESELKQSRSAAILDKKDNKNLPLDNLYYRQKLDELAKKQRQFQEIQSKELGENVSKLERRLSASSEKSVCGQEESDLTFCYMRNRKKSLECKKLAETFTKCVDDYRSRMKIPKDECGVK